MGGCVAFKCLHVLRECHGNECCLRLWVCLGLGVGVVHLSVCMCCVHFFVALEVNVALLPCRCNRSSSHTAALLEARAKHALLHHILQLTSSTIHHHLLLLLPPNCLHFTPFAFLANGHAPSAHTLFGRKQLGRQHCGATDHSTGPSSPDTRATDIPSWQYQFWNHRQDWEWNWDQQQYFCCSSGS